MKRSTLLILVLALGVAAAGQSVIQLTAGAGQTVMFNGQGPDSQNIGVTLGSCRLSGDCTLAGGGTGTGALASSGTFSVQSRADSIVLTPEDSGTFRASASAPIYFNLTGTANGQTGTLLAGTLNLLDFSQAQGSAAGSFNTGLGANLNLTGGLLAGLFSSGGGVLNLDVHFPCGGNIAGLSGTFRSLISALAGRGAGGVSPAPEPSTLALAGTGLLVLGLGLRLRRPHPDHSTVRVLSA